MKFAFLVHPISAEMAALLELADNSSLLDHWGTDPFGLCAHLHTAIGQARLHSTQAVPSEVRVIDELPDLSSVQGGAADGRLYEIPMDARAILEDPARALDYMQQAVEMAVDWGARIVGLGSMTGVIGGRGTHLAEHSPIAVTTGNSLTVYSALQNVYQVAQELDIDLRDETVAIVGVPGSIASATAALLAPQCGELLLVGRRDSAPARKLSRKLGAELLLDIPTALERARVIISATSTGSCIDQSWLQPGSVVVDVGVPTDVRGTHAEREDVLILTGGFLRVPESMPLNSKFLWFQHGMIPSCLGETIVLALQQREESLSLGRTLDLDTVQSIGSLARSHGFRFSELYSFGHRLEDSALIRFHKARARNRADMDSSIPKVKELAVKAPELHARHINPVLMAIGGRSDFTKTYVRGEGAYLFDADGNRYLDFVAGFGSMNLGHNHPAVAQAINEALAQKAPGFAQSAVNPYAATLAKELISLTPADLEMVFFANSGTEAVEAALKLARTATGRSGLLHCEGSFHGKSMGALSLAGNADYRRPFAPLLPDCESVPFGDYEALERALASRRFAAFVVEPIQAEGGIVVPPTGYIREAQALCRTAGTLLIVDEVQTGLGRTGSLFAVEDEGVLPDVMTLAKSLGGGLMPIGAMLTRRDLWMKAYGTVQTFALHTNTFGGGSLACAAGLAALRAICAEDLPGNAHARGRELRQGMEEICRRQNCVREVRGRGLLLGLEFQPLPRHIQMHWKGMDQTGMMSHMVPDLDKSLATFHVVHAMQTLLNGHGIYTQIARSNPFVLRIEPPLTITREQVEQFLAALDQTCSEIDYSTRLINAMIAKTSASEHDLVRRNGREKAAWQPHL